MQKFSDRLKKESDFRKSNIFGKKGRFNFQTIKKVDFENGLKSKDLKNLYFINFAGDENESAYCLVKELYSFCLAGNYDFLNTLIIDDLDKGYKVDRLLDIISNIQGKKYTSGDMTSIYKTRYQDHKELRIYIKRSRNNLSVILIDLYHLGIFSKVYENGKAKIIPLYKKYRRYQHNSVMLDDLKKLKEIV